MIDVLSGASVRAQADATLIALFPDAAHRQFYLDSYPETLRLYPRMLIRHVGTTWKYAKSSTDATVLSQYDETTFEFVAHGDDLPALMRIQKRLTVLFGRKAGPFALYDENGTAVAASAAQMTTCTEVPGGSIHSLPQPNMSQKSIHRLNVRFRCEVTRHL